MAVARAIESKQSLRLRCARDIETSDLLAILFDAAGLDTLALDGLAQAIDSGGLRDAAAMPDESSMWHVVPAAAVEALIAAFELARRAAQPQVPVLIRGSADVAAIAQRELNGLRREHVLVIACDAANRPLRTVVVALGAVDRAAVPVREILNAVLRCDGRAFALAHNHPCGDPEPSDADIEVTGRVAEAARVVGLRFLGHVVVANGGDWTVAPINEGRTCD